MKITKPAKNLYIITRTSAWGNDPEVKDAYKINIIKTDVRTVDCPSKIPAYRHKDTSWWYNEGTNHRAIDGCIARDMGIKEAWAVKIKDLIAFVQEYGQILLSVDINGYSHIEIYDDYRE